MPVGQTFLFTVTPRGIVVNADPLPVSVVVSPRLEGADNLGAFEDWPTWTRHLKDSGLTLEFSIGQKTFSAAINPDPLRPELWEQLFNSNTLVRSHTFDDYSDRGVISYPVRQVLSGLKAIYQEATVALALPDARGGPNREKDVNRRVLGSLVDGLQVHWNGDEAPRWRSIVRVTRDTARQVSWQPLTGPLDREGLIVVAQPTNATDLHTLALPFAVFHHMPTPKRDELKIDPATKFDFHQALSALNSYPELLRALGLVFDLDLPREFVAETLEEFGTISVSRATPGWRSPTQTATPPLATAYLYAADDAGRRYFFAAPRALVDRQAPMTAVGLLNLDATQFGLAQIDVDGGMHKAIMVAETLNPPRGHNLFPDAQPEPAANPEVFDPEATLPSLRSGGLSLFADRRAVALLDALSQSKAFNDALAGGGPQPRPFFAEDLVRGYRLDIWDARTNAWHSLHQRHAEYRIGELPFSPGPTPEEGFVQLAVTQPANGAEPVTNDLYLHEAIARWAGWSLSAPMPSKHLSRYPNAADAVPRDNEPDKFAEDEPLTPFKVTAGYEVAAGSLPRLVFGMRYRVRARVVDLAGNSLRLGDPLADMLSNSFALPFDQEGFTYLRFEPVPAPLVIIRDPKALTEPGSAVDRIVIRTFNTDVNHDAMAADTTAADRHIMPPRTSVEMGERLRMFDDATGKIAADAATWQLIVDRDAGEFAIAAIDVAGKTDQYPVEPGERIDAIPHLPDPLSRGAAIRDLPGTVSGVIGRVEPDAGMAGQVAYTPLSDPNPRPGSATLVGFGTSQGWEKTHGFRFALAEPVAGQTDFRPHWDPAARLLTVYLPKAAMKTVPLTSYTTVDDLKLMGVWQWLREFVERITVTYPGQQALGRYADVDRIAHILQRAVEGGHWMLTPPRLLTLVHAVQQPIGRPEFTLLDVEHADVKWDLLKLQTAPDRGRTDPTESALITSWRALGATDAYLLGALRVHGRSTAKLDLLAHWNDPVDDLSQPKPGTAQHDASVEELPLRTLDEDYLLAAGKIHRAVGYYDPEHDQVAFVRAGDWSGTKNQQLDNAAPRHLFNDAKRHLVRYTAVATSRFREYFAQDQGLDFTRHSEPVVVDVPASARPLAPDVVYVIPTFGWQRQTDTNLKRSVRFGGGLRVYLRRPWFSSGYGELLGVALWSDRNGTLDKDHRDKFKPFFTQWGMDPIWQSANLAGAPGIGNFAGAVASDQAVSLEEFSAKSATGDPGRVDLVGFTPEFDEGRGLWFADLTIDTFTETYMPFVRLALVRYQPNALAEAMVSRVVLADFVQLTPDRSAMVTADPHHPRSVRVVISGVAPRGPAAVVRAEPAPASLSPQPTQIHVRVQQRDPTIHSDLAWLEVPAAVASVRAEVDRRIPDQPDLVLWAGSVTFAQRPNPGGFRLLVEEHEYISANYTISEGDAIKQPGRLIYIETFELDEALVKEAE
jgi:hypothetical protein